MNIYPRRLHHMSLGDVFTISWWGLIPMSVKLIKVTPKGYNLLNVDTNKCILGRHLYPYNKRESNEGFWFFINANYIIAKDTTGASERIAG